MTVELTFTGDKSNVRAEDAEAVIRDVLLAHETESDTRGEYQAENQSIQPTRNGNGYDVHIGLSLTDVDDSEYPDVKTDLADTIANLPLDYGTVSEIEKQINGSI